MVGYAKKKKKSLIKFIGMIALKELGCKTNLIYRVQETKGLQKLIGAGDQISYIIAKKVLTWNSFSNRELVSLATPNRIAKRVLIDIPELSV
jgi:hypothetical protein